MSYFDDHEDQIIYGGARRGPRRAQRTLDHHYDVEKGKIVKGRPTYDPWPWALYVPAEPGSELARARQAAHRAFDPLWKSGKMTRAAAYSDLARRLGIPKERAHMVMFNVATCQRVVQLYALDDFGVLP